jgi:hypothetical protein
MQQANEDHTLIKVEFLCADCKNGKHGCAKLWKGLGLEIRCCCSCIAMRGTTETGNARVREGLREENNGVRGLEFQSEPTTTSAILANRPTAIGEPASDGR